MSATLSEFLQSVRVGEPQEVAGLQVFGLHREGGSRLTYLTLDEAFKSGCLEVTELTQGGSVPLIKVINRGAAMVFLMSGEQLIGAKQNRVLNASIMVAPKSELPIPVSCVEAGRWQYQSTKFMNSGTLAHTALRQAMSKQVDQAYRRGGAPSADQGAIWREVARKLKCLGAQSPSAALYKAYEDYQVPLADVLGQLRVPAGGCGAAFAYGGEFLGADLYDRPATLAAYWPRLVRAYTLDALEKPHQPADSVSSLAVGQWLRSAAGANAQAFRSPGLGEDVRLQGANVAGAGLVVDAQPVHVELFP
jgi:ARG and Rhodanese-Phosphatase-superfamily-associated Protein domain